jgi:hypothetical protein
MRNDHFVQAAYLGMWSNNGRKGRRGDIYVLDKEDPRGGWRKEKIEYIASRPNFDCLGEVEAAELNVTTEFLDKNIIGPIESKGIHTLRCLVDNGKYINQRRDFKDLLKWVMLQLVRTPKGKENLSEQIWKLTKSPVSKEEWDRQLAEKGLGENYLLCIAHSMEWLHPYKSPFNIKGLKWVVKRIRVEEELICCDHPIVRLEEERWVVVPIGPKQLLIGYYDDHPEELHMRVVGMINNLLYENARRFLYSRIETPYFGGIGVSD